MKRIAHKLTWDIIINLPLDKLQTTLSTLPTRHLVSGKITSEADNSFQLSHTS